MIITRHATEYMITAEQKHENVKLHKRIDLFVNLCINNSRMHVPLQRELCVFFYNSNKLRRLGVQCTTHDSSVVHLKIDLGFNCFQGSACRGHLK